MWSLIKSYFEKKSDSDDLTLEKACSLLEESVALEEDNENMNSASVENALLTKSGTITKIFDNHVIINDLYICDKNLIMFNCNVGTKVSYDILVSDGNHKVVKVSTVDSEWDISENKQQLWSDRIIICKVERRTERTLFLSPGDLEIDLNTASLEFLPIIGDWLELDVKCTVNEDSVNLLGSIIEINKILPVRPHIVSGTISSWNNEFGLINKNIFYNKNSLSSGYIPFVGDRVVVQVIESEQNRCCWRALQVIPESLKSNCESLSVENINIKDFDSDYPGVVINGLNIHFENLNTTKYFCITILNNSDRSVTLKKAEMINQNSQCKILNSVFNNTIKIGCDCKINCVGTAKNIGNSKDFLLLTFSDFTIGKWITVNVSLKNSCNYDQKNYNHNRNVLKPNKFTTNQVIKGEGTNKVRFQAVKIPSYEIPQKLLIFFSKYDHQKDSQIILEELKSLKPVLFSNLSYTNYEDKFHTLLHLDEISNLIAVRCYDQDKACFIANNEFLMLEIENLSERRPSIVIGDKILASDPLAQTAVDYEGIVHKVSAKHVWMKFSPLFHDQYNGEDYTIRVIPGRQSYRRLHHAIYLSVRNLGGELLFPSKLIIKEPQFQFKFEKSSEQKTDNQNFPADQSGIKLEWYNKKLNVPQQNAVFKVLSGNARPLPYIIFGPPGTGKTVTLIEIILQITRCLPQSRLLITAPSNSAADLIAVRLIDSGVLKPGDLVRLISYNYAMSESIPIKLIPYCATGSNAKEGTLNSEHSENGISFECSRTTVGRHRITVATCSAAGQLFTMGFAKGHFSHIIVDEAAQAAEPEVMIPISFLDKTSGQIILAGDPMQLGPVVLSRIAEHCGMSESYLERLNNRFPYVRDSEGFPDSLGYNPNLVTKLIYNYRALPVILDLYSGLFYNDELISTIDDDTSEEVSLLNKLEEILPVTNSGKNARIIFHGVNGENYQSEESPSWCNPHEAAQIFYYINEFYRLGLNHKNIGIITPYIKQVKEIRSLLMEAEFDLPKIGTVEEFQGQEFDIILISTVRSCQEYVSFDVTHSLGFVASPKRLNVAVSRAKSLLIVVGNPNLLSHDVHWRSVIKYCAEKGSYVGCDLPF